MDYAVMKRDFWIVNIAAGSGIVMAGLYVLLQLAGILPSFPCPVHEILGIYCPGCGGTRAVLSLFHGHVLQSLFYNPAVLFGGLLVLYYEIGAIVTIVRRDGRYYLIKKMWPVYTYLGLIGICTIIRDVLLLGFGIDFIGDFMH